MNYTKIRIRIVRSLSPVSIHPLPENPESDPITAKIVFRDPIPRGEYNLVVSTRCGDGRDYALRRIGHPVTVP